MEDFPKYCYNSSFLNSLELKNIKIPTINKCEENDPFKYNGSYRELKYYCNKKDKNLLISNIYLKQPRSGTSINIEQCISLQGFYISDYDHFYASLVEGRLNDYYIKCLRFENEFSSDIFKELGPFICKDVITIIISYLQPENYNEIMNRYQ